MWQDYFFLICSSWTVYPEDKGITILTNVITYSANDIAEHAKRLYSLSIFSSMSLKFKGSTLSTVLRLICQTSDTRNWRLCHTILISGKFILLGKRKTIILVKDVFSVTWHKRLCKTSTNFWISLQNEQYKLQSEGCHKNKPTCVQMCIYGNGIITLNVWDFRMSI